MGSSNDGLLSLSYEVSFFISNESLAYIEAAINKASQLLYFVLSLMWLFHSADFRCSAVKFWILDATTNSSNVRKFEHSARNSGVITFESMSLIGLSLSRDI